MKDCKILCDGREMATVHLTEDGFVVKHTEEGKKFFKQFKGCC